MSRAPLKTLTAAVSIAAALATGTTSAHAAEPSVIAPSAAVIETTTGTVLYEKNADQQRGMASTTKLMTALTALDEKPLSTVYTAIDYGGSAAETRLGLIGGEKMTLADLVRAMMLPSANDAAQTIAIRSAGTKAKFVAQMNAKAKELGLTRTHFTNSIGLDAPTHRTTALELAKIGAAAHENPFLRATVKRSRITLASGAMPRTIVNRNGVLGLKLGGGAVVDGMKTGHTTAAGYSLVGSATRGGVSIVSVVLGEPSEAARDADSAKLLRWASRLMVRDEIVKAADPVANVPVSKGKAEAVKAITPESVRRVIARGAEVELTPVAMSPGLEAPVRAGVPVGTAQVRVNGELVETVPLVTASAIERQSTLAAIAEWFGDHWKGALLSLLLVLGGTLLIVGGLRSGRRAPTRPRTSAPVEPTERTTAP
ncbi:MAG: D-alanyl-D-alanine carboxypeptidase family protein [Solirubrobacteraceae bacterium]|nr:D-alanyl-D-alanine carboxypeptidase family protein [Solirubrobacteraceae bacterium]